MKRRGLVLVVGVFLLGVVWLANRGGADGKPATAWTEVVPGVFRSPGEPAGYALVSAGKALLIDAPTGPEGLQARGIRVEQVLLSHHHRDSLAAISSYLEGKIPVRAPAASAPWL